MSWLDSLNTIKGQLTSLAQEVLAEGTGGGGVEEREPPTDTADTTKEESSVDQDKITEDLKQKNEELNSLCSTKDNEIAALRKQLADLQTKTNSENAGQPKTSTADNATTANAQEIFKTPKRRRLSGENEDLPENDNSADTEEGDEVDSINNLTIISNLRDVCRKLLIRTDELEKHNYDLKNENLALKEEKESNSVLYNETETNDSSETNNGNRSKESSNICEEFSSSIPNDLLADLKDKLTSGIDDLEKRIHERCFEKSSEERFLLETRILILQERLQLTEEFNSIYRNRIKEFMLQCAHPELYDELAMERDRFKESWKENQRVLLTIVTNHRKNILELEQENTSLKEKISVLKTRLKEKSNESFRNREFKRLEKRISFLEKDNTTFLKTIFEMEDFLEEEVSQNRKEVAELRKTFCFEPKAYEKLKEDNNALNSYLKIVEEQISSQYEYRLSCLEYENSYMKRQAITYDCRDREIWFYMNKAETLSSQIKVLEENKGFLQTELEKLKMAMAFDPKEEERLKKEIYLLRNQCDEYCREIENIHKKAELQREYLERKIQMIDITIELRNDGIDADDMETSDDEEFDSGYINKFYQYLYEIVNSRKSYKGGLRMFRENRKLRERAKAAKSKYFIKKHALDNERNEMERKMTDINRLLHGEKKLEFENERSRLERLINMLQNENERYQRKLEELVDFGSIKNNEEKEVALINELLETKTENRHLSTEADELRMENLRLESRLVSIEQNWDNNRIQRESMETQYTRDENLIRENVRSEFEERIFNLEHMIGNLTENNKILEEKLKHKQ